MENEMKKPMPKILKFSLSSLIILAAVGVFVAKYWDYVTNPWTRDGQVRAQVIQITPRVSGPIVNLPIKARIHRLYKGGSIFDRLGASLQVHL